MPDAESDGDEADTMGNPEVELDALLKGKHFVLILFSPTLALRIFCRMWRRIEKLCLAVTSPIISVSFAPIFNKPHSLSYCKTKGKLISVL